MSLALNLRPGISKEPTEYVHTEADVGISANSRRIGLEDSIGKKGTAVKETDNKRTMTATGTTQDEKGGVEFDSDYSGDVNVNHNVNDEGGENETENTMT